MKTTQELKELLYKNKTVADQQPDAIAEANAFCEGYKAFLNAAKTEREAAAYDEKAVEENKRQKAAAAQKPLGGCPGSAARSVFHQPAPQMHHGCPGSQMRQMQHKPEPAGEDMPVLRSQLSQWPVQIKLVPVNAPYFDGAKLLIAADCTAYAYANFHQKFIRGHITLVGCPKLDDVDYSEKLTRIIRDNDIKEVTIVRMEVPCCGGLEQAVRRSLAQCGKDISLQVVTLGIDGQVRK